MKTAFAVFVAFIFLLVGWFFLAALLFGVGYVASHAREGVGLMHFLHVLLMWVLGHGFGGFLATYITPQIFKDIDAASIATSFMSVVITLAIILGLLSLLVVKQGGSSVGELILFVVQVAAVIIGARIGKSMYVSSNA